jgi:hypothetical protein
MSTGPQDGTRAQTALPAFQMCQENFSNDSQPTASDRRTGGPAKPPFGAEDHGWL